MSELVDCLLYFGGMAASGEDLEGRSFIVSGWRGGVRSEEVGVDGGM